MLSKWFWYGYSEKGPSGEVNWIFRVHVPETALVPISEPKIQDYNSLSEICMELLSSIIVFPQGNIVQVNIERWVRQKENLTFP